MEKDKKEPRINNIEGSGSKKYPQNFCTKKELQKVVPIGQCSQKDNSTPPSQSLSRSSKTFPKLSVPKYHHYTHTEKKT